MEGALAGAAHGDAIGDGGLRRQRHRTAALDGTQHRGKPLRLHADDAHIGPRLFHRAGDAADQAAAADRHHDRFDIRKLLQHLEPDRALPGDDLIVIEGMDEGELLLLLQARGLLAGFVIVRAVQDDLRAKAARGGDLYQRRGLRHDDARANAQPRRVKGHALRVIAGARGDHAVRALLRRELQQPVQRAALLEGAGTLQILQLEIDGMAGQLGEIVRYLARRIVEDIADALASGRDTVQMSA